MARGFTNDFETELSADKIKPRIFYEGDFGAATGANPLKLWTGEYDITWDSKSWLGNGWLHGISAIQDVSTLQAVGARINLTGVPLDIVQLLIQNNMEQGAPGKIWLGFLDSSDAVVADPHLIFSGDYSHVTIKENPASTALEIHYESKLTRLNTAKTFRYTDAGQKLWYSGDRGFEYVAFLKEWDGFWGRPEVPDNG